MNSGRDNFSDRELWDDLYQKFKNEDCDDCFKQITQYRDISFPQPIPYIGPDFGKDAYCLMFVGIQTYGNVKRESFDSIKYDLFDTENEAEGIRKRYYGEVAPNSAFWKWVRIISEGVLGKEQAFKQIAYTNLAKCQCVKKGRSFDTSQYELYKELFVNCIRKAGWIYREIERIDAKNVVLFSGRANECELARIFLTDDEGKFLRKFDYSKYDFTEEIRRKWTNRDLFIHLKDGTRRFIVTNHPQGTPTEIRDEIVRVIKSNDWNNSLKW